MGFVFIGLIGLHVVNNSRPLTSYLHSKALWATLAITAALTSAFLVATRARENRARLERQPRTGHGTLRNARR